jgi:hypothetical protein
MKEILENSQIFKIWENNYYGLLLCFTTKDLNYGDIIYKNGEDCKYIYFIINGEIEVN